MIIYYNNYAKLYSRKKEGKDMDYLMLKIKFMLNMNNPDLVKELHKIYREHGFSFPVIDCPENEKVSYEEACKVNQFCYDNNIVFEKWEHFRMRWSCDWISFADTTPCIEEAVDSPFDDIFIKEELIMFPEEEAMKVLAEVFSLANDLYLLDFVHAVEIQKEYY